MKTSDVPFLRQEPMPESKAESKAESRTSAAGSAGADAKPDQPTTAAEQQAADQRKVDRPEESDPGAAGSGPVGESTNPTVQKILAEYEAHRLNGDEKGMRETRKRLTDLGYDVG
jgi:hypothetical protein